MKNTTNTIFLFIFWLFCCVGGAWGQQAYYDRDGQFWIDKLNPPKPTGVSAKYPKQHKCLWGIYFWEYPDGTYEKFNYRDYPKSTDIQAFGNTASRPTHQLLAPKSPPKLYLTPFNSSEKPKTIPCSLSKLPRPASGKKLSKPGIKAETLDFGGKIVHIETSSKGEAVPGHPIRVAISYKGASEGGKLAIYYNESEGLSYNITEPFSMKDINKYFDQKDIPNPNTDQDIKRRKDVLKVPHSSKTIKAFAIPSKKKDIQTLFFTLEPSAAIDTTKNLKAKLFLSVLWIPNKSIAGQQFDAMTFEVLKSHDPNNLTAPKKAYKDGCECSEKIKYKLEFENEGPGEALDVTSKLPLNKSFIGSSFKPLVFKPSVYNDNNQRNCLQGKNCQDFICYRDTMIKDTIMLTFCNIGLKPSKFLRKKSSRGSLVFSIEKNANFRKRSGLGALIFFPNNEPIFTGLAKTQWRQRGFYIKPGYSFGLNQMPIPDSIDAKNHPFQPFNIGILYQDAPLGKGFLSSAEVSLSRQRFIDSNIDTIPASSLLSGFTEMKAMTFFDLTYLNLIGGGGYQIPNARVHWGLGLTIPILASETIDFRNPNQRLFLNSKYGFFQRKKSVSDGRLAALSASFPTINAEPGIILQWGVEFGRMNTIAVGVENQIRYFPKFNRIGMTTSGTPTAALIRTFKQYENPLTLTNFNTYIRFNLGFLYRIFKKCGC